ncbi:MAG: PQQ-binding-like beta-propeller repeat protein [Candidatus Omnitrophica bacterium]|nr:PQQ-binding-like beta-propeller repeat protein [Candidatus Omnitrophota bacterium]
MAIRAKKLVSVLVFCLISLTTNARCDDWSGFQHDLSHSGSSSVNFTDKNLSFLWSFSPTGRTWNYKSGSSVWSSSVSIADVEGKSIVYAGFYNNNFYAVNAEDGSLIWRFIGGNRFNHAPVFAKVNNRSMVFVACADRSIYCLDGLSGEKIWSYETLPWSYMLSEAIPSSPIIIPAGKLSLLVCAVWNSGHAPFNNFQKGELYVLNAATGEKLYSVILSSTPLNSPCFADINGEPAVFISSNDGNLVALNAKDGKIIWQLTLDSGLFSSPSILPDKQAGRIFIGSRFGNLYCLDAATGKTIWTQKTGHAIDSTAAIGNIGGNAYVYIGSYDRNIYCFDAATGEKIWNYKTGDYVVSSCSLATVAEKTVVFAHSLDNKLYCLDGLTGSVIWSFDLGKLIWTYNTRGDTIWSSPAVGMAGGKPILVFPCYDSKLYAFSVAIGGSN